MDISGFPSRERLCFQAVVLRESLTQILINSAKELFRCQPRLLRPDQEGEILGHSAGLNSLDDHVLQGPGEVHDLWCAVQGAAVLESARPREDGGDRVRRGGLAGLVLTVPVEGQCLQAGDDSWGRIETAAGEWVADFDTADLALDVTSVLPGAFVRLLEGTFR